jgi:hypothetical protein
LHCFQHGVFSHWRSVIVLLGSMWLWCFGRQVLDGNKSGHSVDFCCCAHKP